MNPETPSVEFRGPFSSYVVVVDGWTVPFLEAHMRPGGKVNLVLDHRWGLDLTVQEADRIIPWLADLVAVASGYSCHPGSSDEAPRPLPHSQPRKMIGLDAVDDSSTHTEGGCPGCCP